MVVERVENSKTANTIDLLLYLSFHVLEALLFSLFLCLSNIQIVIHYGTIPLEEF